MPHPPVMQNRLKWLLLLALLVVLVGLFIYRPRTPRTVAPTETAGTQPTTLRNTQPQPSRLLPPPLTLGKTHPPLPYRIISFHRGRADKNLIALAARLGFNGVQIQIEGSTLTGMINFAQYDSTEHLVDFCHALGMQVTLWTHEFSDLPPQWMPEYLGDPAPTNTRLWSEIDRRYDILLSRVLPQIDGLCLTVVETQIRATDPAVMAKLSTVIANQCQKHHKTFIVRTFVWFPNELAGVMGAVAQLPPNTLIMTKCVPQDWQMRGTVAAEIGNVGPRPQIIEYDIAGEYFLRNKLANCFPDLLQWHYNYDQSRNANAGICVRVDRLGDHDIDSVLNQPNEVNLWALAYLAGGVSDNIDDAWTAWAENRFGKPAAPAVIRALKPTGAVVSELLSVGPFSFGDTRLFPPPLPNDIGFEPWQNWHWNDQYLPDHQRELLGDPAFTATVAQSKQAALTWADASLTALEDARPNLTPEDYAILHTRLLTNKTQLAIRTPMALATLHYRHLLHVNSIIDREKTLAAIKQDLATLRTVALPIYPPSQTITHLNQPWTIGPPEGIDRDRIYWWAWQVEKLTANPQPLKFAPEPVP